MQLHTPLRVLSQYSTDTPNATLAQIYRDLGEFHISGTWFDADAVQMYLDHRKGIA
jgi:hypothetical protein